MELVVTEREKGWRLDKFLMDRLPSWISRSAIQRAIRDGRVLVDGYTRKPSYRVKVGEKITVETPEPKVPDRVLPEPLPLDLVYEDRDIVVVNKPPGMMVHPIPSRTSGTLVNALLYSVKDLQGIGGKLRPGIVHRLDKDTSGVMVVAKNELAHRKLSGQFKNRVVKKVYLAIVRGRVKEDEFEVDLPIARHPVIRVKMSVVEGGKPASTRFEVLRRFGDSATLLKAVPKTGRTHQIRVHLKHIGHPILGDEVYGGKRNDSVYGARRQMLHALKIGFYHPRTGDWMEFVGRIPKDFKDVLINLAGMEVKR